LAGERENTVGIDFSKAPEAEMRGEALLKAKFGMRGIVNARMMAILHIS
jgi:hypothetical protein